VKGIYLAVATLAAHFILTFVFREWEPVTGGVPGTNIPRAKPVRLRVHR
jgi:branched-chain amino acid transport system permease protein